MDRQEFLMILRESLSGEVPEQEVNSSIRYYEEYLVDEPGKTSEEKVRELGEPRLIAKTIIDAYEVNHENGNYKSYSHDYEDTYAEQNTNEKTNDSKIRYYSWDTMKWYHKLAALVIICVVISVLISVFTFGISVFFRFVFPILVVVFGVKMIMQLFR